MRIGIIGAGNVGSALARRFADVGHQVIVGTRDVGSERIQALLAELPPTSQATAASVPETAATADVVILTTPWNGTEDAVRAAGDLANKVLIDCTNPLAADLSLLLGHDTSGGEVVASLATNARVVKAFNTTGAGNMANSAYATQRPAMFVCGDDPDARTTALALAEQIGFEGVDCGSLAHARLLEPLAELWIWLAYRGGLGLDFAFALLKR
jgi:NADPH-dependent F420 reductase